MKRLALILVCCAAVGALTLRSAEAEPSLGIGSKAPALDIEHYIQDGNGRYPKVTELKSGKIYVVEFWATWCGPCIQSMPHLAGLQNQYREQGVQIISISDETLDEVEALLKRPYPGKDASFSDITSAYTLTTDPDRSVHVDYMEASEQQGIPTSFIVGKTGLIEWIGHPMEMDDPLQQVVEGSWNREAFKEAQQQMQQFQANVQEFAQMAGQGKIEEAGMFLRAQLAETKNADIKGEWQRIQHDFHLMTGQLNESDIAFFRSDLKMISDSPFDVVQYASKLYGVKQEGGDVGPLAKEVIPVLKASLAKVIDMDKPVIHMTVARMHAIDGNFSDAIKAQTKAVELADARMKKRLIPFLEDLKEEVEKANGKKGDGEKTSDEKASLDVDK